MEEHQPKLKKRMTIMIIALAIVFGGIIGWNILKGIMMKRYFSHYKVPAVTVASVIAKEQDWEPIIPVVGNFVAINGVEVNSEAAGNVVEINFDSGQYIQKDKPLIRIDDSVDQATLKFNQSELALQKINYQRQADLFKRGATSTSTVDEFNAKLQQAQANVEKTQAEINQKHITAPFSGQLGIRQVNLGQYIFPGQTSIVTLQSLDPLFLEFYLPEQLLKHIHIDQKITFSVEQNPGLLFEGKITAINSKIDINTHNVQVQATVPNCPAQDIVDAAKNKTSLLKIRKDPFSGQQIISCDSNLNIKNNIEAFNFIPGMFAAIEIEQPTIPHVVVLPSTSISYSLYGNSVYIIEKNKEDEKDADGKEILVVKRVFVTTGDQQGNYIVINSGVKPGQVVVSSGELKLEDGTRVVINNDVQLKDVSDPDQLGQ
jgi:membrane fusion protein (multidrug efflux system)